MNCNDQWVVGSSKMLSEALKTYRMSVDNNVKCFSELVFTSKSEVLHYGIDQPS